mmetsp:Transcript_1248/g.1986  ORF Transcript_1248/g.1986 Transcript_1248/m.1986 type:complete len:201 (+) Transcript_1248:1516-2118(+)
MIFLAARVTPLAITTGNFFTAPTIAWSTPGGNSKPVLSKYSSMVSVALTTAEEFPLKRLTRALRSSFCLAPSPMKLSTRGTTSMSFLEIPKIKSIMIPAAWALFSGFMTLLKTGLLMNLSKPSFLSRSILCLFTKSPIGTISMSPSPPASISGSLESGEAFNMLSLSSVCILPESICSIALSASRTSLFSLSWSLWIPKK